MRLVSDVVSRQVNDELLLLDLTTSRYFQVNPAGTVIWQALTADDGATIDEMVTAITTEFPVDDLTARRDLELFLADLRSFGALIE